MMMVMMMMLQRDDDDDADGDDENDDDSHIDDEIDFGSFQKPGLSSFLALWLQHLVSAGLCFNVFVYFLSCCCC